MQQSSFIGVLLARHVSGDVARHQERRPLLYHVVFCAQFCCVAVRLSRKFAAWSVCMVWWTVPPPFTIHSHFWCAFILFEALRYRNVADEEPVIF
jgi:hypothetical protein